MIEIVPLRAASKRSKEQIPHHARNDALRGAAAAKGKEKSTCRVRKHCSAKGVDRKRRERMLRVIHAASVDGLLVILLLDLVGEFLHIKWEPLLGDTNGHSLHRKGRRNRDCRIGEFVRRFRGRSDPLNRGEISCDKTRDSRCLSSRATSLMGRRCVSEKAPV